MIVGIDCGTMVGIAALDLNGNLVKTATLRNAGWEDVIESLMVLGKPSLVACDVATIPDNIRKIASSFRTKVFRPGHDLTTKEKKKLSKTMKFENLHERDAFVAARKAYNTLSNMLRKIECSEAEAKDKIKHLAINNARISDMIDYLA